MAQSVVNAPKSRVWCCYAEVACGSIWQTDPVQTQWVRLCQPCHPIFGIGASILHESQYRQQTDNLAPGTALGW
jgi:hypothetical protein